MYRIKIEELDRLGLIGNKYYAEALGITPEYVSYIKCGKFAVKTPIAKGMISLAYGIPLSDYKIDELLEKHFTKEK